MLSELLVVILIVVAVFGFIKVDCHIYLWFLDKFASGSSFTEHLRGQVVWITGASSGIGEHIAYEYARIGCKLVLSGTNQSRLASVKTKCLDLNSNLAQEDVLVILFDIADYSSHKTHVDRVLAHFKKIDILVNNAGRSQRASFEKTNIQVDEEMFKVNVFGPVHLSRLVVDHWLKFQYKGQIAVTSSVAGICPAPFSATYCGTKYALHGYFETLRVESFGRIKVTMLCPGPVHSRVLENAFTDQPGITVNKPHSLDAKRMSTQRCAKLCVTAITHRVTEAWISMQPILTLCYFSKLAPYMIVLIFTKFMTEEKFMKIREGQ